MRRDRCAKADFGPLTSSYEMGKGVTVCTHQQFESNTAMASGCQQKPEAVIIFKIIWASLNHQAGAECFGPCAQADVQLEIDLEIVAVALDRSPRIDAIDGVARAETRPREGHAPLDLTESAPAPM